MSDCVQGLRCRRVLVVLFFFVLITLLPSLVRAQTAQTPPPPPPRREISAEFAFVGTSGNSSTQSLGFGGELIFRPAPWETRFKAAYVRNEVDNELKAEPLALSARVQRLIRPRLSAFGQWGYLRDEFAGISARNNVEGGISYVPVDQAPHKLTLDAAVGYTNEQRLVDSDLSSATLVTGGLYTLKFSETSELSEDGRFTFLLSDGGDWRFTNIIALTAKMTTVFSLKLSNNIRYVSAPVVGFETTDSVTAIALVAKF